MGRKLGYTSEQVLEAFEREGSVSAAARLLGTSRQNVQKHLRKVAKDKEQKPLVGGTTHGDKAEAYSLPPRGKIYRYILTSAQNNTRLHDPTWLCIETLAKHYSAKIMVGTVTYNQNSFSRLSVKRGTKQLRDDSLWYDSRLMPHIVDATVELAPGLLWCGRMNTLPTTADPLLGFDSYAGQGSGIFPHAKHAMRSIATEKHSPAKFNYTTATCTKMNYLQKRAGILAEHHHTYGALLVEVDSAVV